MNMSSIKKSATKLIPTSYFERKIAKSEKIRFDAEARETINTFSDLNNSEKELLFKKWFEDYEKYKVTFNEYYYQYDFPNKTDGVKSEYISVSTMQKIYRLCGSESVRGVFRSKPDFLTEYRNYIHREWILVTNNTDPEKLDNLLNRFDVIVKPINGTRGEGVRKIKKGTVTAEKLLSTLAENDDVLLVEECITANHVFADFHPNSLNTIRFVTFMNNGKCKPVLAFFRTGAKGSVVDNYHGGGISAEVDVNTGIIVSDGKKDGINYPCHPDTGVIFKGTQLPKWDKITEACINATKQLNDTKFAGWDVVLNADGEVEFVEANHAPDIDIPQAIGDRGFKKLVFDSMNELGFKIPNSVK